MAEPTDPVTQSTDADLSRVDCSWIEKSGKRVLCFEALSPTIDERVWILCLSKYLAGYQSAHLRLLSDARKTTEVGNAALYAEIVRELVAKQIKSVRLALVTHDAGRKILVQLLRSIAEEKDVEIDIEVFFNLEDAWGWVVR